MKQIDPVVYTGASQAFPVENIVISGDEKDANASGVTTNNTDYVVSYKLGNAMIEG